MPIRNVTGTDAEYYLLVFDDNGAERREPDGTLMSERARQRLTKVSITDVFIMSHGWLGDVPAAITQYDAWVKAMMTQHLDRAAAREREQTFAPLILGLHWPSLPWGDESIPASGAAVLSPDAELDSQLDAEVNAYASRIADTPKARVAIRSILLAARQPPGTATLSSIIQESYATLFSEAGLASGDPTGRPGADQDGFDPVAIIAQASAGAEPAKTRDGPGLLGLDDRARDILLIPLRQLSFWKMKDRASQFGETGGHDLLRQLQTAAPKARFHLMGHSFGCIVVSATVAGPQAGARLPRPVNSLFLVQGALSLWSYAGNIPYAPGRQGYFHRIIKEGLADGPVVTTRSSYDTAVGFFYPLGAQLKQQLVLGQEYPAYGGIGAYGIRGLPGVKDTTIQSPGFGYDFSPGGVYNLEGSRVIKNGGGPSGAHCDIVHPEVAHVFWEAALASPPPRSDTPRHRQPPHRAGLLGPEPPLPSPDQQFVEPGSPSAAERWISASIEFQPPDKPLVKDQWYTLAYDVDVAAHTGAIQSVPLSHDQQLFAEGTAVVLLTVQLDTDDFDVSDRTRPIRLPRAGKALTKARFDIMPRKDGPSTIKATIHKDGNFIHQMELTFNVGAEGPSPVQVTDKGRPPAAALVMEPREIGLTISPVADGYDCVVWGAVSARARLTISRELLANAVDNVRSELLKVVMHQDDKGEAVFQTGIKIPDASRDFALKTMARAGAKLFRQIFFGDAARADSKAVGEYLQKMTSDPAKRVNLQIVAESTPVPWGLLYVGDASAGAQLDWKNFLGMRHSIEQIPLQNTLSVSDSVIASDKPHLAVSLNMNNEIDTQMGANFVAQQLSFWEEATKSRRRIRAVARLKREEVVGALADGTTDDQILYLYCHAASAGLADPGGPDESCLVLSDGRIKLGDLNLDAPTRTQLRGNPLVFINACESAQMSPLFYDGFVPYFMAKGARGVVGTECKTPALFAMAWAKRFFERFLDGDALGEAFLGLRREFLDTHGNPLGLLYAVHCDGDTQIRPAVVAVSNDSGS